MEEKRSLDKAPEEKTHSARREVIHTDRAPAAIGPYSQAIRAGELVYSSGQLGIDPATGKLVEGGIEPQTSQVLRNLAAVLDAAGTAMNRVIKTTVFVTNLDDFPVVNKIYGESFSQEPPARSTVQVSRLPLGGSVEIEAVALAGKRD